MRIILKRWGWIIDLCLFFLLSRCRMLLSSTGGWLFGSNLKDCSGNPKLCRQDPKGLSGRHPEKWKGEYKSVISTYNDLLFVGPRRWLNCERKCKRLPGSFLCLVVSISALMLLGSVCVRVIGFFFECFELCLAAQIKWFGVEMKKKTNKFSYVGETYTKPQPDT